MKLDHADKVTEGDKQRKRSTFPQGETFLNNNIAAGFQ
jgi:hypothetical protein